jgi:hypothetical protein
MFKWVKKLYGDVKKALTNKKITNAFKLNGYGMKKIELGKELQTKILFWRRNEVLIKRKIARIF